MAHQRPGHGDDDSMKVSPLWRQSQGKIVQCTLPCCVAVSFLGITLSRKLRIGRPDTLAAMRQKRQPSSEMARQTVSELVQVICRAAKLTRAAAIEPATSIPRQASSMTTTEKPSATASSAE